MLKRCINFFRRPQPKTRTVYILFALFLLAVLFISVNARYAQLGKWKENSRIYYATGTPMTTTLDAYKFLRHAKEYKEGTFDVTVKDKMIFYPDGSPFPDPVPLLSVILDFVADKTGTDVYTAGTYLVPVASSLFIIPLALYFLFMGFPSAGILGGFIGTFAPMFYIRTSMGRLDTDGGNLFFLFTASLFVLLASKAKNKIYLYAFSALLGLTIMFFYRWYHHGMFNLFYLAVLAICLALAKFSLRDIIAASFIYLVFACPIYTFNAFGQLINAIKIYIFHMKVGAAAIFPNVYDTIGEAQQNPPMEVLRTVITNPYTALLGIFGCMGLVIGYFRYMLPLAPIAALGGLAFFSAGRFSMFIGPIVGVGMGYLCVLAVSLIKFNSDKINKIFTAWMPFALIFLIASALVRTGGTAMGMVLPPSIQAPTYQTFKDMKKELPAGSAIYTWWDYGLAIADATGFPVFHSGMTQDTPKTWLIAKSLTSDQQTLYNIISYLDNYGVAEIEYMASDNASLSDIMKKVSEFNEGPSSDSDFLALTDDMVVKLGAIGYLASWTKETGAQDFGVRRLQCAGKNETSLSCGATDIDLQLGLINKNTPIKETIITRNGKIENRIDYNFSQGYYILVDKNTGVYLMDGKTFRTSFVQLYFLGLADPALFRIAMDRYPYARIYKVLKR